MKKKLIAILVSAEEYVEWTQRLETAGVKKKDRANHIRGLLGFTGVKRPGRKRKNESGQH